MVVGIGGYYGYKNAGDEAILQAMVRELKIRGHRALVLSASPRETARELGVEAVHRYHPLALPAALRRVDRFVLGGGGLLQDRTSRRSLAYYLGLVRLARRLGKPVTVFGVSLGPLSPRGERRVARTLSGVPVVVRDLRSLRHAERLGLRAELGADPALLLEPPQIVREPGLVVVIPRHGVPAEPLYAGARKLLILGYDVLVLGLQPGPDDLTLEIFEYLPKEASRDPKRVLYLLRSAEYVISARLHGMILAAAAGTPFAGVHYDPKVASFAEETGSALLPLEPTPNEIAALVQGRIGPDWNAVEQLKARARASFERVFPTPAPTSGA